MDGGLLGKEYSFGGKASLLKKGYLYGELKIQKEAVTDVKECFKYKKQQPIQRPSGGKGLSMLQI